MKKQECTVQQLRPKKPYEAPKIEVYEYHTEDGFQVSEVSDVEVFVEYTDESGDNELGGEWF